MDTEINTFISKLPKAELHVHLEGIMTPETWQALAAKNNVPFPWDSTKSALEDFEFKDLFTFLDLANKSNDVLCSADDFMTTVYDYLKVCNDEGCKHVEILWGPVLHTCRVSFKDQVKGMRAGFDKAHEEWGMTGGLIFGFVRQLDVQEQIGLLKESEEIKEHILGVGLAGMEQGFPTDLWVEAYKISKQMGYKLSAHVGEEGTSQCVWNALENLNLDRIDHGISIAKDEELIAHVKKRGIHVTLCPVSNVMLKVYENIAAGPCKRFLDEGMSISINSDDPPFFQSYINHNYEGVAEAFHLDVHELARLAKMSFEGAWLSKEEQNQRYREIDQYVDKWLQTSETAVDDFQPASPTPAKKLKTFF